MAMSMAMQVLQQLQSKVLFRAEANLDAADCAQQAAASAEYQAGQCKGKAGLKPEDTTPTMIWTLLRPGKAAFPVHSSYTATQPSVSVLLSVPSWYSIKRAHPDTHHRQHFGTVKTGCL